MTVDILAKQKPLFLSVRLVEWSMVAALILILAVVFMHRVRVVQRQAELAAVRVTLGALRTALVFQHLQAKVPDLKEGTTVAIAQHNPFEMLERRPSNYWGEVRASEVAQVPPGSWIFDADCVCVGYLPNDATDFDSPSGESMAWYKVVGTTGGPLQISPRQAYRWHGEVMN